MLRPCASGWLLSSRVDGRPEGSGTMRTSSNRAREKRWAVIGEDGRHVWLGRHSDPSEDEISRAEEALAAGGIAGFLAIVEGDDRSPGAGLGFVMVRPLAGATAPFRSGHRRLRSSAASAAGGPPQKIPLAAAEATRLAVRSAASCTRSGFTNGHSRAHASRIAADQPKRAKAIDCKEDGLPRQRGCRLPPCPPERCTSAPVPIRARP